VEEAKLSMFQQIDRPVSPGNRGLEEFYKQATPDVLQEQRNRYAGSNFREKQRSG
jgi:hypothetical protein